MERILTPLFDVILLLPYRKKEVNL